MKEKFGQWWLDVAKYIFTGVILASVFNGIEDNLVLFISGFILVALFLGVGLWLLNDSDNESKKKKGLRK